jgi:predicted RNA-binding Zn ribbon-like protein
VQLKAARQLKEITEQLAKAKKARESGRSDRDLKALELKLSECQSMVDEVGDPPLKFLKAAERVKLVPPTTPQARARWHSWPQSSICKYTPYPPFFSAKIRFCRIT